mmetsp:Transcript_7057/g.10380  ORF Transcript_7057/g.10380 Transcript_7057/m.10380 type:complete len:289 (+) Transcript_7057:50-916(+)
MQQTTTEQLVIVTPGETIMEDNEGYLLGHGTYLDDDNRVVASKCGIVERISQYISVKPLQSRYMPRDGDVIVGRISKLTHSSWVVDINGYQDAILRLSSVNIATTQRRKTYEDSLNMRALFVEDDVIVAEIMDSKKFVSLQTRSARYGKLSKGIFIKVKPMLIKPSHNRFHTFSFGTEIIIGANGYIFIRQFDPQRERVAKQTNPFSLGHTVKQEEEEKKVNQQPVVNSQEHMINMIRVRNAVAALDKLLLPIHPDTILKVVEASRTLEPKYMIEHEHMLTMTASIRS